MKRLNTTLSILLIAFCLSAQNVAINSDGSIPHASAMLDVKSTSQGFLPPRLTQAQRSSISSPAIGLIVYQTDYSAGYYFYTGSEWIMLGETPGVIKQYAAATAPAGYLLCQGQAVSRTTYAALFQVIGTTYGAGDGSTTFNLPDLRTRVPVGLSSSGTFSALNNKGGAETHTITIAQMPAHDHSFSATTSTDGSHSHPFTDHYAYSSGGAWPLWSNTQGNSHMQARSTFSSNTSSAGSHTHTVSGTSGQRGSGGAIPIVQPYIVVNYIIKY